MESYPSRIRRRADSIFTLLASWSRATQAQILTGPDRHHIAGRNCGHGITMQHFNVPISASRIGEHQARGLPPRNSTMTTHEKTVGALSRSKRRDSFVENQ